jgi:hypothetical protein
MIFDNSQAQPCLTKMVRPAVLPMRILNKTGQALRKTEFTCGCFFKTLGRP